MKKKWIFEPYSLDTAGFREALGTLWGGACEGTMKVNILLEIKLTGPVLLLKTKIKKERKKERKRKDRTEWNK